MNKNIDTEKVASEIKKFLDSKKFDLVDYSILREHVIDLEKVVYAN